MRMLLPGKSINKNGKEIIIGFDLSILQFELVAGMHSGADKRSDLYFGREKIYRKDP